MDKGYNKFQYSYFLENGAQVVVRADSFTELTNGVNQAIETYPVKESTRYDNRTETRSNTQAAAQSNHYCDIHQREMKQREHDGQTWYDHRQQINNVWNMCTGKGWKAQKPKE